MPLITSRDYDLNPNIGLALEQGMQAVDQRKSRGLELDQQKVQGVSEQDTTAAKAMISGAQQLRGITDPTQKLQFLNQRKNEFREAGMSTAGIDDALNLARTGDWDALSQKTDELIAMGQQMQGRQSFQFGSSRTFKDSEGNIFVGSDRRDPKEGTLELVLDSVDGGDIQPVGKLEETGSYGLTAGEKVKQITKETTASGRAANNEKMRDEYVTAGLKAGEMIPETKRLLELNKLISTGKTAGARKAFGDLFGTTDPNLGEFNAKAGQLVLSQIRLLGANPTEGERTFLSEINPSLQQGGAVNETLLKDMIKIQERQVARGKWMSNNPNRTVEDYLLLQGVDDFVGSSGGGGVSDDEAAELEALKKSMGF